MRFMIASDLPGRIRVRCGKYAFKKEQALAVSEFITALPFVSYAEAGHMTGSILVRYEKGCRIKVLEAMKDLSLGSLEHCDNYESTVYGIETNFKERLYSLLLRRAINKLLLPEPVRIVISAWRGVGFFRKGISALAKGKVTVEVLDGAAVGVSLVQRNFNTASSIMFLLGLAELLEDYTRQKNKNALSQSLAINVDTLWVMRDGAEVSIPAKELAIGDNVIIRTGLVIPVDGKVASGEASVNQASMTGEPLPVLKKPGDTVFAGTVIEEGSLVVEAKALTDGTRISRIVEMIDQSESLKAGIHARSERIADKIVPMSFLLSAGVFAFTGNFSKALSVLLVDYSCAIKMATPITVISAMREASFHKIVVKGGKYLEAMAEADTIVFDKTGTLTVATPEVSGVVPFEGYERKEILRTAACLEEHFPHSVARAVVRKAIEENLRHDEMHTEVEYLVAHGIASSCKGQRVVIGSSHFVFDDEKVEITSEQLHEAAKCANGDSVIYLGIDGKAAGFICINDPPKQEAKDVIAGLKRQGIKQVIMLTGDSEQTAKAIAAKLGVDSYRSQVLPEDKAAIVAELKAEGKRVIMVGDGINDSPALAAADASISMKDASDIAREVADITLLSQDLYGIITLRELSEKMMKRIHGNFRFIMFFNTSLLVFGLGNMITPAMSALLHNVSTLGISAASMRPVLKQKETKKDMVLNSAAI